MAAMKVYKPGYSYVANQSNFSKYSHQEEHHNMSQSSHIDHGWARNPSHGSSYYGQAQARQMGRASYGCNKENLGHSWADGSTQYHAQAHTALPTPSVHLQQGQHMMEKKESDMAQEWGPSGGAKCARSYSSSGMMSSKMENGGAYQYTKSATSGGGGYKPAAFSGSNQANHSSQMGYNQLDQRGWASNPTKVQANQSSLAMHKQEHMAMHDESHIVGGMDHGWSASPTKANQSSYAAMHQEDHHGWVASPTKAANHLSHAMHKEEHMMGQMEHGWAASPTEYSSSNHANYSMYDNQDHHGWGGTNSGSYGSAQMNHSAHHGSYNHHGSSYEDDHEDVHDIMDEILTKYPAHNVSGGHGGYAMKPGASMSQSQEGSYAKQEAWAASSAHHGGVGAQSMAWNERKEKKEAYSASSSVNKYGMSRAGMSNDLCIGDIGI